MNFDPEKVQKRVEGMSEGELLTWLSSAIPGMQRHLEQYQMTRNADHLGELAIAEMSANVVITELMNRKFAPATRPAPSVPSEQPKDTDTTSAHRRSRKLRWARTGTAHVPGEVT